MQELRAQIQAQLKLADTLKKISEAAGSILWGMGKGMNKDMNIMNDLQWTFSSCKCRQSDRRNKERAQRVPWTPPIRSKIGANKEQNWGKRNKMCPTGMLSFMKIPQVSSSLD